MDQVQSINITASNQAFNGQWSYDYEGISLANLAISYLTDAAITAKIGIDPALKDRLLGEVYFLRAFYYFDLVNNFGDVPLVLQPLSSLDEAYSVAKRETKDKVYAQISADLAQAKTLLPNTVNVTDKAVYKLLGATNTIYKGNDDAPSNKIYIRLADVLLWKAEAYNETGNYPEAIAIINTIRNRARTSVTVGGTLPPPGTLPDRSVASVDKNEIMGWLMHERRVELGFESQRFNDLKRWAIAKQVLTALGKNFQDFNYLYPIPQGEIDKSGGTITQNPSY